MTQKEIKLQEKPWISKDILKAIHIRDRIYKDYIQAKDPIRKTNLGNQFKTVRNRINDDIKLSKKSLN